MICTRHTGIITILLFFSFWTIDVKLLSPNDDINEVIDSWPQEAKENQKLKLVYKDPSKVCIVLNLFLPVIFGN